MACQSMREVGNIYESQKIRAQAATCLGFWSSGAFAACALHLLVSYKDDPIYRMGEQLATRAEVRQSCFQAPRLELVERGLGSM
eukprot:9394596-Pyramimonas_sp.AAC.1